MLSKTSCALMFGFIVFCLACSQKNMVLENYLNANLSDHTCQTSTYISEFGCPVYVVFKIDCTEKDYYALCKKLKLIALNDKKKHLNELFPYDQEFNNNLWITSTHFPGISKVSWWDNVPQDSLSPKLLSAPYYFKEAGQVIIGDKAHWKGHITLFYHNGAAFGNIELECEPSDMKE
jgi:hypothetical protein